MGRPKTSSLKSSFHEDMIQLWFDLPLIDTLWAMYANHICNKRIKIDSWASVKVFESREVSHHYYMVLLLSFLLT